MEKKNTPESNLPSQEGRQSTREEYLGTEQNIVTTNGFIDLAGQVLRRFEDRAWVKRLYEKAADRVKGVEDLRKIARSLPGLRSFIDDGNREFEKALYLRVLEKCRTKAEYILYAQLMSFFLKDGDFSHTLCRNIEAIFLPKRVLDEEYKSVVNNITDKTAQEKMEAFAEFLKKYKMNKHIKDIYFKLGREFAQINKREALIAYLKYYQLSFKDAEVNQSPLPEPIPDRVKKQVFKHEKEVEDFMEVIEAMKQDLDIGAALAQINERYRRKISLDKGNIDGIKSQHAGTVEKLRQILEDDDVSLPLPPEPPGSPGTLGTLGTLEPSEPPGSPGSTRSTGPGEAAVDMRWSPGQAEFLRLFVAPDYSITASEAAEYARQRNLFVNQLINGINEIFFEMVEDMLIEEADQGIYRINPEYRKIPGVEDNPGTGSNEKKE